MRFWQVSPASLRHRANLRLRWNALAGCCATFMRRDFGMSGSPQPYRQKLRRMHRLREMNVAFSAALSGLVLLPRIRFQSRQQNQRRSLRPLPCTIIESITVRWRRPVRPSNERRAEHHSSCSVELGTRSPAPSRSKASQIRVRIVSSAAARSASCSSRLSGLGISSCADAPPRKIR